ncbi:MAG: aldo/keto reductase [Candidatus Aminicenantales bacterium]|jgi:predicted aldo/keto reductase-like oxidoreductase
MGKNQRREFLKKSLIGMCGAAFIPGTWKASFGEFGEKGAVPTLASRKLGRTGIKTPLISMGTSGATSPNFIRMGYDAGIKLFFSATYYGQGNNERLVGEALKDLPRDSFVVGTAATPEGFNPRAGTLPKDMNAQAYMKTAEESLKRFGLDHVDILLLPFAGKRESVMFDPILKAMTELKKQGKIRFAGIATHGFCEEALRAAADAKVYDVAMTAYNYKTENKEAMNEALAYAAKAGMGIVAMKTTAGAAQDKNRTQPLNTNAALKWVLQNKNISSIVSGMSTVEELQKNLEMIKNLKISDQELKDLNLADLKSEPGLYCHQCQKCIPQCPNNLDIPTLMRSYMYAYGYRNVEQARRTLNTVDVSGKPCEKCDVCSVTCIAGFDIKDRIQDIVRLKDVPSDFIRA